MSDGFVVQCPECLAKMRLKSEASLGRKTKCPKCQSIFTPELPREAESAASVRPAKSSKPSASRPSRKAKPASGSRKATSASSPRSSAPRRRKPARRPPEDDYDDYDDGFDDDFGDDYDDFDAPEPRSRRSGSSKSKSKKKKKKKSSSGGWQKPAMIGGLSVLGLIAIVGIGFAVKSALGFGGNEIDLTYLQPDVEVVMKANVAEIWDSAILSDLVQNEQTDQILEQMKTFTGDVTPKDIESVTIGMTGLQDSASPFNAGPGGGNDQVVVAVVRFNREPSDTIIDQDDALSPFEKAEHNGTEYLKPRSIGQPCLYRPTSTTWVFAEEDDIKGVIDRGDKEERRKDMDFVDGSHDLLFVLVPKQVQSKGSVTASSIDQRLQQSFDANVKSAYFGFSFGSGVDMEMTTVCYGSDKAESMKAELDKTLSEMKSDLAEAKANAPAQFAELMSIADQIVNDISVSQSGTEVNIAGTIPGSIKDEIKKQMDQAPGGGMAGMMMQSMLSQAMQDLPKMGAPPSGPGGGFPNQPTRNPQIQPGGNPLTNARSAAQDQTMLNNLRALGLAMHNHHDATKKFPAVASKGNTGQQLLSWRVHILPYLGQKQLYDRFHLDEPWDSPHNKTLIPFMPREFRGSSSQGKTTIVAPQGQGTIFENGKAFAFREITDGSSNTIMLVEVSEMNAITWTQPDTFRYNSSNAALGLNTNRGGRVAAVFADGSAQLVNADPKNLRAMFTRNGSEVIQR